MLEGKLFFLVRNNFGSSEDSPTIEYTEHGLKGFTTVPLAYVFMVIFCMHMQCNSVMRCVIFFLTKYKSTSKLVFGCHCQDLNLNLCYFLNKVWMTWATDGISFLTCRGWELWQQQTDTPCPTHVTVLTRRRMIEVCTIILLTSPYQKHFQSFRE